MENIEYYNWLSCNRRRIRSENLLHFHRKIDLVVLVVVLVDVADDVVVDVVVVAAAAAAVDVDDGHSLVRSERL